MACLHTVFQLPAVVMTLVFYVAAANPFLFGAHVPALWAYFEISLNVTSVGLLSDFFIYFIVYLVFRKRVRGLCARLFAKRIC